MEFGEEVIKFLVKEKFSKFSFIEGAKGNEQNLTFKYMDNCTVNDVKEHIDWAVYSARNTAIQTQAILMKKILI